MTHPLTTAEIEDFVDPKLQHGRSALKDNTCEQEDLGQLQIPSSWKSSSSSSRREADLILYREIMR